jgi:uncharacterized protein (DUF2141 family)
MLSMHANAQSAGNVVVHVQHQGNEKGYMMLALYKTEDGFPSQSQKAIIQLRQPVKAITTTMRIDALPAGNYAIAVFHDKNNDGKLNTNMIGAPTEAYGFSNNARKIFSAPSFKEAMFQHVNETTLSITIK